MIKFTVWFTGDWHYGHRNILRLCNRPFKDINEMNKALINTYLENVKVNDDVYFVGDLTFTPRLAHEVLSKIFTGKLHFIRGNHDKRIGKVLIQYCEDISDIKMISINGQPIVLCHYPMLSWEKKPYGAWQFFGHCHGRVRGNCNQYDVGVDNNSYKIVSFEDIKSILIREGKLRVFE